MYVYFFINIYIYYLFIYLFSFSGSRLCFNYAVYFHKVENILPTHCTYLKWIDV